MTKLVTKEFLKLANNALKEKLCMHEYGDDCRFNLNISKDSEQELSIYIKFIAISGGTYSVSESILYNKYLYTVDSGTPIVGLKINHLTNNKYQLYIDLDQSLTHCDKTLIFVGSLNNTLTTNQVIDAVSEQSGDLYFESTSSNWTHITNQPNFGVTISDSARDSVEYYSPGKIFDTILKSLETKKLDHDISFISNTQSDVSVTSSQTNLSNSNIIFNLELKNVNNLDQDISYNSVKVNKKGQVIEASTAPIATAYNSEDHQGVVKVNGTTTDSFDDNNYLVPIVVNNDNEIFANMQNYSQDIHRYSEMPAAANHQNEIVQYIGTTTSDYVRGYFYESYQSSSNGSAFETVNIKGEGAIDLPGNFFTLWRYFVLKEALDPGSHGSDLINSQSIDIFYFKNEGSYDLIIEDTNECQITVSERVTDKSKFYIAKQLNITLNDEFLDNGKAQLRITFTSNGEYEWVQIDVQPHNAINTEQGDTNKLIQNTSCKAGNLRINYQTNQFLSDSDAIYEAQSNVDGIKLLMDKVNYQYIELLNNSVNNRTFTVSFCVENPQKENNFGCSTTAIGVLNSGTSPISIKIDKGNVIPADNSVQINLKYTENEYIIEKDCFCEIIATCWRTDNTLYRPLIMVNGGVSIN